MTHSKQYNLESQSCICMSTLILVCCSVKYHHILLDHLAFFDLVVLFWDKNSGISLKFYYKFESQFKQSLSMQELYESYDMGHILRNRFGWQNLRLTVGVKPNNQLIFRDSFLILIINQWKLFMIWNIPSGSLLSFQNTWVK